MSTNGVEGSDNKCDPASSSCEELNTNFQQRKRTKFNLSMSENEIVDEEEDSTTHSSFNSDIYMSVTMQGSIGKEKIGVSYYNAEDDTIYASQFHNHDDFYLLKHQLMPHVIITNSKNNNILSNAVDPSAPFRVEQVRRREFSFETALTRLRNVEIREMSDSKSAHSYREQTLKLMSVVDISNREMICSLGGLFFYLTKSRVVNQLEDASAPVTFEAIRTIDTETNVHIDRATLDLLGVFADDSILHARRHKEGHSVMSLLNQTLTTGGQSLLRRWLMCPTRNPDVLTYRQNHVAYFIHPSTQDLLTELRQLLRGVKDVTGVVNRIAGARATIKDWENLSQSLHNWVAIHSIALKYESVPVFQKLFDKWNPEILALIELITRIIDFPESKNCHNAIVRSGLSEELDDLRLHYEGLEEFLTTLAKRDLQSNVLPNSISCMNYTYFPQLGYLLVVPRTDGTPGAHLGQTAELEFKFQTDDKIYFKNSTTVELDTAFGDIQGIISDLEAAIIRELANKALECSDAIAAISPVIYEIDCLISMAVAASGGDFVRPEMVEESVLDIKDGRHPLQEMCVDQFIPNNTILGRQSEDQDGGLIHIITGPNSSGKSIYLKQVGIIVFLAHIGSFVPAKSARIGFCDRIFFRFEMQETCSDSLSSFSSDCSIVSYMLRHCTNKSMLLIDEFGKRKLLIVCMDSIIQGTCKEDGVALFASTVQYIASFGTMSPRTIVTTHFHEIFKPFNGRAELLQMNQNIRAMKMDIFQQEPTDDHSNVQKVVFLYKLIEGISHCSYGFACAKAAGMPDHVLDRAKEVSSCLISNKKIAPLRTSKSIAKERFYRKILDTFNNLDLEDPEKRSLELTSFIELISQEVTEADGEGPYTDNDK